MSLAKIMTVVVQCFLWFVVELMFWWSGVTGELRFLMLLSQGFLIFVCLTKIMTVISYLNVIYYVFRGIT